MSQLDKLVENFEKNVSSTIEELKKEITTVKSALAAHTGGKFLPLETCVVQGPCSRYSVEIATHDRWSTPTWQQHVSAATAALAAERQRLEEIHARNLPKIETNKKIRAAVVDFMKTVGIDETYSVYEVPNSRSRTKQWLKKKAGFTEDLARVGAVSDYYEQSMNSLKDYERRINEYKAVKQREETALQQKNQADALKAANLKELAVLSVKYNTAVEADEVLDAILLQNKYLRLAHFLLLNREDWNDGYSYAQQGLNGFSVENEHDAKIHEALSNLIENWDGDGRVFRDSEYGYDSLFELANSTAKPELIVDYNKAVELGKISYR